MVKEHSRQWGAILKLMVAYAYAVDRQKETLDTLPNTDRRFILAMWYYYVCQDERYVEKYGNNVPLTQSRMVRMNNLWKKMSKYYKPTYSIDRKYRNVFAVYPLD